MSSLVESPEYQACLRFIELTVEKRACKARLDELEEQLKAMQPALLGYLTAAGLKKLVVNDYLLYPHREPWVKPMTGVSRQTVCEALKISGLGYMVKEDFNTMTLTSYIKQLEENAQLLAEFQPGALDKLLPPALASILNVKAAHSLRIKKQASSLRDADGAWPGAQDEQPEEPF